MTRTGAHEEKPHERRGGDRRRARRRLVAVCPGWAVALLVGLAISALVMSLYGLLAGSSVGRGAFGLEIVVIPFMSGFLALLTSGYVAGRPARTSGGKNGATTAVLAGFGTAKEACAPVSSSLTNLFGDYVGGLLGDPPPSGAGGDVVTGKRRTDGEAPGRRRRNGPNAGTRTWARRRTKT